MRDIPWHALLLLSYLVSRLRITVPASSIMKVKSGTRGKVLGREPGRWSRLYWVCYYLVPCRKCKENPENQWLLGCVCVGGCLQNSAWYRMHVCFSIPPAFPWVFWDLLHSLDPDSTVLFSPGKPHHFQTVPSVCFPLPHSPVVFPFQIQCLL